MDGEIDDDADIRHARWERSHAGDGNRENVLAADCLLDRLDGGIEALDVPDHQCHIGAARGGDDFTSFLNRRGDRLFHHNVNAMRDTVKRNIPMEMSRSRDRDRVDLALKQFVHVGYGGAAEGAGYEFSLLPIGIRDADQFSGGQTGEYTSMIAAHDAHAHNAHTQRALRACYCSLHHLLTEPQRPISSARHHLARQGTAGDYPSKTEANTF